MASGPATIGHQNKDQMKGMSVNTAVLAEV